MVRSRGDRVKAGLRELSWRAHGYLDYWRAGETVFSDTSRPIIKELLSSRINIKYQEDVETTRAVIDRVTDNFMYQKNQCAIVQTALSRDLSEHCCQLSMGGD